MRALIINGPNLNLLGSREAQTYGTENFADLTASLDELAVELNIELTQLQSNAEHELVNAIQGAVSAQVDYIIMNPAAFTHTSIALRDALLATGIPFIELHISNVHAREPFRRKSFFSDIASGIIVGFGTRGYRLALHAVASMHAEDH